MQSFLGYLGHKKRQRAQTQGRFGRIIDASSSGNNADLGSPSLSLLTS
jgi:hypothetical protein